MWGEKSTRANSQIRYGKISYELSNYNIALTVSFTIINEWKPALVENFTLFSMHQKLPGNL